MGTNCWPCQVTAFASGTHVLFWIWKEELQISLHFLPEGQSFSLLNLWYLKISRKHRAWDSPKSRLCRKESLCWKGQEGQCPWVTAVLLSKHWVAAGAHSMQRICLQGQCQQLPQALWLKEDRLAGSQGDRGATRTHLERCPSPESGSSCDLLNWFSRLINDLHCLPC